MAVERKSREELMEACGIASSLLGVEAEFAVKAMQNDVDCLPDRGLAFCIATAYQASKLLHSIKQTIEAARE